MVSTSRALTVRGSGLLNRIETDCAISSPTVDRDSTPARHPIRAIWDTGATGCAIADPIAKGYGLPQIDIAPVNTAGGKFDQPVYLLELHLPNGVSMTEVRATGMSNLAGCDFLIGMDVMCLGDVSISNLNGQTVFSFRYPSCREIDFVVEASVARAKEQVRSLKRGQMVLMEHPTTGKAAVVNQKQAIQKAQEGWHITGVK